MAKKTGRFTHQEQEFIAVYSKQWTVEQIAQKLDRDPISIRKYIKNKLKIGLFKPEDIEKQAECELKNRPTWKDLERQLSPEELEMFAYHWKRIASQFKDDITPTEEWQVIDAIKLEIMMNRIMIQQKNASDGMQTVEKAIQDEKDKAAPDPSVIAALQNQLMAIMTTIDNSLGELRELLAKKNSILKEMKATRADRKKHIEDSSKNYAIWLSEITSNRELRIQLGTRMEKMRLAMEKERERLSQYHTYIDGNVDTPLFNHEVAEKLEG